MTKKKVKVSRPLLTIRKRGRSSAYRLGPNESISLSIQGRDLVITNTGTQVVFLR